MEYSLTLHFKDMDDLCQAIEKITGVKVAPVCSSVAPVVPAPAPLPDPSPSPVIGTRACLKCGALFYPKVKKSVYCSSKCYQAAYQQTYKQDDALGAGANDQFHKKVEKVARENPVPEKENPVYELTCKNPDCKKKFTSKLKGKKYCSAKCNRRHYYLQFPEKYGSLKKKSIGQVIDEPANSEPLPCPCVAPEVTLTDQELTAGHFKGLSEKQREKLTRIMKENPVRRERPGISRELIPTL